MALLSSFGKEYVLVRRQRLLHRFIQLGPFEVAAAVLALTLASSFSYLTIYSLYLDFLNGSEKNRSYRILGALAVRVPSAANRFRAFSMSLKFMIE